MHAIKLPEAPPRLKSLMADYSILITVNPERAARSRVLPFILHHTGVVIFIDVRRADIIVIVLVVDEIVAGITFTHFAPDSPLRS